MELQRHEAQLFLKIKRLKDPGQNFPEAEGRVWPARLTACKF